MFPAFTLAYLGHRSGHPMRPAFTLLSSAMLLLACGQEPTGTAADSTTTMNTTNPTAQLLTVEIWSDVVCPFCYIGKREFENALARFPHRDSIRVEWKSFELDPNAPSRSPQDTYGMLSEKYGMTREQAMERTRGVRERAATLGLHYDFDKAIVGSSFHAHRLIQLAKTKGLSAEAEERLFRAYFTDGEHLADTATLVQLGTEIGLDAAEVERMMAGNAFGEAVRRDEQEAQQIGVRGVPFFLLADKYTVSGAQSSEHFLGALEQAWRERASAPAGQR
jgi:predicted DsbA family dithiol-disulfide isomerase